MSRHDPADDTRSMFNTDHQVMSKKEGKKEKEILRSFFPPTRGEREGLLFVWNEDKDKSCSNLFFCFVQR